MKLGILCTMMKRFGLKGLYNSQEIGLGRALSEMGHSVIIYKGVKDKKQVETVQINERLTVQYLWMPYFVAHGWMPTAWIDKDLDGLFVFSDQQIFLPHVEAFCRKNGIVFVPYVGTTYSLYVHTLRGWIIVFAFWSIPSGRSFRRAGARRHICGRFRQTPGERRFHQTAKSFRRSG